MQRQRILVASGNAVKLAELTRLCADLPVEIFSPTDLPDGLPEVIEDGNNFLDNAEKKARAFAIAAAALGDSVWALADDSGLCVDALDGAPGVHSARFAGEKGPQRDQANNHLLLQRLEGMPAEQRGAAFWCVIAVANSAELLFAVEGSARGTILDRPRGDCGFGYDPLFLHPPSGRTFAELDAGEKAAVSHRGQAVARLRTVLATVLPAAPA